MKKEIYRYIGMVAVALGFVACANDNGDAPSNDGGKTPIDIAVAFVDGEIVSKSSTRAVDKTFEANDKLVAHLQHVTTSEGNTSPLTDNKYSKTVVFTVKDGFSITEENNTQKTSDITPDSPLYWDDFSDATNDIRTGGHGLRSAWGYCYNGKENFPESNNHTDEITWEAATDQKSGFKTSDLLWSKTQDPVSYQHGNNSGDSHGTITIPYTHAMSKATIVLTAGEGFGDKAFENTTITLKGVNIKGKFTATTATVVGTKTGEEGQYETGDIQMQKKSTDATNNSVTFECVFVPNTLLNDGKLWAEINNVAGNNYEIKLTSAMLATEKWGAGPTKSGVNYKLAATISKQKIDVVAQIADWIYKETSADGKIQFSTDLTEVDYNDMISGTSYDVFTSESQTSGYSKSTTRNYTDSKWTDYPVIYWQGEGKGLYFRGLAKYENNLITSVAGSTSANQGTDLLWATTPQHTGKDNSGNDKTYEAGDKIDPRTSFVPLKFEHAMSKVKFVLKTTDENTKVNLEGATLSIPGITTNGTIDVANGNITIGSTTADLAPVDNTEYIVIPQNLDGKKLTITLNDANADGKKTTYSILLTDCKVDGNAILSWERGNSYEYTITLAKEAIQFRALIKEWNEKTGSGDASLDWD
ncbi:MAG: fimbrillin family protein [Prevotella sp.]|nr:fimbrillin family protein [Prevotella sp.]